MPLLPRQGLSCVYGWYVYNKGSFVPQEVQDLYDMLLSKLNLQRKAYKHKTVRLIEQM